jgi:RNA polymerase sigma factor (sigma-70 family)
VLGFCRSRLRTKEEAEDAAQTTFCYALGALRRGVVPATETAWLLKIARNVCLNRWDANRRRSLVEVPRDPQVLQEVVSARDTADGDRFELEGALEQLTELQRRAIVLREWQGLSYGEIADELELSRSAVETLIFRARRALARNLRGLGSIVSGLKSVLTGGGAAVKTVAAVIALATAGAIGEPRLQHVLQHGTPAPAPPLRTSKPASSPALPHSPKLAPAAARSRETSAPPAGVAPVTAESPRPASPPPADPPARANGEPAAASSGPTAAEAPPSPGGIQPPAVPAPVAPPSTPDIPAPDATAPELPSAPSAPAAPTAPELPTAPVLPSAPPPPTAPALPSAPAVPTVRVPEPVVPTVPTVPAVPTVSVPSAPALP